jgi:PAS domain S-box-containing protein
MFNHWMIILTLLSFMTFLVFMSSGWQVIRLNPKSRLNRIFLALSLCFSLWALSYTFLISAPSKASCWAWYRLASLAWCLFPALMLHFFLILTSPNHIHRFKHTVWLLYIPPAVLISRSFSGVLLARDFYWQPWGWAEISADFSFWTGLYICYLLIYVIIGLSMTFRWGRSALHTGNRIQARIISHSGIAAFLIGFIHDILLPNLGIKTNPYLAPLAVLLWIFSIRYTILKYNLMVLTPAIAVNEIISRISDMIILTDEKGLILQINKRVIDILGFDSSELLGKPVYTLFCGNPEDSRETPVMGEDARTTMMETSYLTRDGLAIPVKISFSVIRSNKKLVLGIVLVAQDLRENRQLQAEISKRRLIAEDLQALVKKLQEYDNLKSEFLSTVSHEFRTPLTSVLGFAKIIRGKLEESLFPLLPALNHKSQRDLENVRQDIDIIISEGERLTHMINNLLDITKIEAGKMELKKELHNMADVIQHSISAVRPMIDKKQLRIECQIPLDLPQIVCDQERMIQVLINLLSNAVKFSEQGVIRCGCQDDEDYIIVSIQDEGVGIESEDQSKIFDKFRQIGDTLTNKPKGWGLGLSICKQIIEHHGGAIGVESTPGRGSTFYFTLPKGR